MRYLTIGSLLLLGACTGGDPDDTDPNTGTDTVPPSDPCVEPGNICLWMGVPSEALFSPEGLHRLDTRLYLPQDVEFSPNGTPYVVDFNNHRIRRVNADETVTTVTGTGMLGDGPEGDSLVAAWNHPTTMAFPPGDDNSLFVAAWHNSRINVVHLDTMTLEWYAGTGGRQYGGDGGDKLLAVLDLPSGLAFDDTGMLYISDQANHLIRTVDVTTGLIDTLAGTPRTPGYSGDGGPASAALLHGHTAQKADPGSKMVIVDRILYFTDTANGVVRTIDLDSGIMDAFAGRYVEGADPANPGAAAPGYSGDGGDALDAVFNTPRDVAVADDGRVFIADTKNNCIRVVGLDGIIDTYAGACGAAPGYAGDGGPVAEALFHSPFGVSVHEGYLYITDTANMVVRRVML